MHKLAASQETPPLRWTKVKVSDLVCLRHSGETQGSGIEPIIAAPRAVLALGQI